MTIDLQKIRDELPSIGANLGTLLAKDGIGMLQENKVELDEVGEIEVAFKMKTKEGDYIKFFMGVTTELDEDE